MGGKCRTATGRKFCRKFFFKEAAGPGWLSACIPESMPSEDNEA